MPEDKDVAQADQLQDPSSEEPDQIEAQAEETQDETQEGSRRKPRAERRIQELHAENRELKEQLAEIQETLESLKNPQQETQPQKQLTDAEIQAKLQAFANDPEAFVREVYRKDLTQDNLRKEQREALSWVESELSKHEIPFDDKIDRRLTKIVQEDELYRLPPMKAARIALKTYLLEEGKIAEKARSEALKEESSRKEGIDADYTVQASSRAGANSSGNYEKKLGRFKERYQKGDPAEREKAWRELMQEKGLLPAE